MPKYKVKSPLSHDGVDYPIGSTVEMTEKQADPLLGGALARPGEDLTSKDVAQGVQAVQDEAARLNDLRAQLNEDQLAIDTQRDQLRDAQDKLADELSTLKTDQEKLAADRADLDKQIKAAAKKS